MLGTDAHLPDALTFCVAIGGPSRAATSRACTTTKACKTSGHARHLCLPAPEGERRLAWTVGAEAGGRRAGQNGAGHVFPCGADCCCTKLTRKSCTAETYVMEFPVNFDQQDEEHFKVSKSPWFLFAATLAESRW